MVVVEINLPTIPEALSVAIQHYQAGRLQAAEQVCRQILQAEPSHVDALHLLGVIACIEGKTELGAAYIRKALQLDPDNADAHYNLGNVLKGQGNPYEAAACYRGALALQPDHAEAHFNLGIVSREQGKLDDAIACYRRTLALQPDYAEVHNNLGNALREQAHLNEAVASYRRALALKPDYAEAHSNLGLALREHGKLDEAVASYRRALALQPDHAEMHNNLGIALWEQGKLDEAVACYERALGLNQDYAEAHFNLGIVLSDQGKLDEAVACYRRALALKPEHAEVHNNLGNALREQAKLNEAVACYRRALAVKPDYAEAHSNLGVAFSDQGDWKEASTWFQRALALKPDYAEAHWNHSLLMLLTGDFGRGWPEYEWRWKIKQHSQQRSFAQPLWDGQPLAGKTILLHAEQGLGDTIQFVRYAPIVKQEGGTVLLDCPAELVRVLHGCAGIDRVLTSGYPLPPFDVHAPLMSLPRILKTTLSTVPAAIPYLRPDAALTHRWQQELGGPEYFKIGIVWQGNPRFGRPGCRAVDQKRSIPLTQFEPLAQVPSVRLFSLQKGYGTEQLAGRESSPDIVNLGDRLNDFMDTAAVMMHLDLIISADTSPLHLAGALGRPVWAALPLAPCWRWLLERADSQWYPTMRLFRQKRAGDWSDVFERMAAELSALVRAPPEK